MLFKTLIIIEKMEETTKVKVLSLRGSKSEMGYQYGKKMK